MISSPLPDFRLHHIGYLVKDIDASTQDFIRRLGYRVESEIIEDCVQTAYVQFIRQPNASHWIELIMPNGPHSKLISSIRKGGGLHHLCYEVENIEYAIQHLRNLSMLLLAEPVLATAFPGRRIAWLMDSKNLLIELVEKGPGNLSLDSLKLE